MSPIPRSGRRPAAGGVSGRGRGMPGGGARADMIFRIMPSQNTFHTRTALTAGGRTLDYFSLPALAKAFPAVGAAAVLAAHPAREPAAARGRGLREGRRHRGAGRVGSGGDARRQRDLVHAGPGAAAGLHRRAVRGRPGGDARRHHRARRRSGARQPAAAGRAGHRPLGAGRSLRHRRRARAERRPRVPAQPRALRVPALGPGRVPQLPRGAARDRHRAPGQHRVPGAGRLRGRRRRVSPTPASAPTRTPRW